MGLYFYVRYTVVYPVKTERDKEGRKKHGTTKTERKTKENFDLYVLYSYFLSLLEITWIQQQTCVEGWCDGYVGFVRS